MTNATELTGEKQQAFRLDNSCECQLTASQFRLADPVLPEAQFNGKLLASSHGKENQDKKNNARERHYDRCARGRKRTHNYIIQNWSQSTSL